MNKPESVTVVVVGDASVGKSSSTLRYIKDYFIQEYDPTIEDSYRKVVTIDGKPYEFGTSNISNSNQLDILDTAGREDFSAMQMAYYKRAAGFLLVYDITNRRSFVNLVAYYQRIMTESGKTPALVLIGNKCDLKDKRQVTMEEGNLLLLLAEI
jgi:GTPase KRas protein